MLQLTIDEVVRFCRSLREHALAVTPAEVLVAVNSIHFVDATDRDEVFLSLRSVLTSRVEDFPIFEELFQTFWNKRLRKLVEREPPSVPEVRARQHAPGRATQVLPL